MKNLLSGVLAAALYTLFISPAQAAPSGQLQISYGAVGFDIAASRVISEGMAISFSYAPMRTFSLVDGSSVKFTQLQTGLRIGKGASGTGLYTEVYTGVAPMVYDDKTLNAKGSESPLLLGANVGWRAQLADKTFMTMRAGYEQVLGTRWLTQPKGTDFSAGIEFGF